VHLEINRERALSFFWPIESAASMQISLPPVAKYTFRVPGNANKCRNLEQE
jgi:hypothetical protein